MNPSLMGYLAAVVARLDGPGRQRVADELAAVEHAVATDPALRAALTDTSIPPARRRDVLAQLLEGKVGEPAARIAAYGAATAAAQDVPASLTEAAQRARAVASDPEIDEPPLSVLASRARVGGYAAALFEDEPTEALDGVEDDLFHWAVAIGANAELRRALTNRDRTAATRAALVAELLGGRGNPITLSLATYAVVGGRPRDLLGTLEWLVDRVAQERGWRVARVWTAKEIDDETHERLATTLRALVGRPVELEVAAAPELLGGVLVEVGDLRVDATARARLDALRDHLTADRGAHGPFAKSLPTQGAA